MGIGAMHVASSTVLITLEVSIDAGYLRLKGVSWNHVYVVFCDSRAVC